MDTPNKKTRKRCDKGYHKDKNGECVAKTKKSLEIDYLINPPIMITTKTMKKRCEKGYRKDKNGECVSKTKKDDIVLRDVTPEKESTETTEPREDETLEPRESRQDETLEPRQDESPDKQEKEPIHLAKNTYNEFLLKKEKTEADAAEKDETNSYLYPILGEPDFAYKIALRKEFADTKYDGDIESKSLFEKAEELCNADFELSPHQQFVKNFLSFQTPYNTLLLYHNLGSGKTCSAIGIAEETRGFMKQMGFSKLIIVVASPNVQQNFRIQLFDERKLVESDGLWNMQSCVGNTLISEINPLNLKGLTKERVVQQINTIINKSYRFMGYGEFANYIDRMISIPEDAGFTPEEMSQKRIKNIKYHFNKRLVIIDEIHNIRLSEANKEKRTALLLNEIASKSDDMRLVLLSGTPMYNSYSEIIWLTNLMNINDGRGRIQFSDIFLKTGEFKPSENGNEGGEEMLRRKLRGYISYVRGENPFIFPYRVYPPTFSPDNVIVKENYPKKQMNGTDVEGPIKFIPVYMNKAAEYQTIGYNFIINDLLQRSYNRVRQGKTVQMPSFENMESFGYTLLLAPIEALNIVYPSPKLERMILEQKDQTDKKDKKDQETNTEKTRHIIASFIGKTGLANTMSSNEQESPYPLRYGFDYRKDILKKYGRIFSQEHLYKYSHKIDNICKIIKKSKGIILIYSRFIDGGCVPIALALEELGLTRFGSAHYTKNLFKKPPVPTLDALTMEPVTGSKMPARYVMITGDKHFSPNNAEDMKFITSNDNKNGELVKVIVISQAAAEGLDFKNIRQVHLLDPWYNMNRTEQIIGRAVRNGSHCALPFEERNVEIYLHATELETGEPEKTEEPADLYVYRVAEKKAVQTGRITRLLKEIAVDCILNISQTNFTQEKLYEIVENQDIKIQLSSKPTGETIEFMPGDKPYTDICDYMDNCSFKCDINSKLPTIKKKDLIRDTYNNYFVESNSVTIMKRIKDLFKDRTVYKRKTLIGAINHIKKYPITQIYYALTRFVNNRSEQIVDQYGRSGFIINQGEYYIFQPYEVTDLGASIYDRSVPVTYKREILKLELPPEMKQTASTVDLLDHVDVEKVNSLDKLYEELHDIIDDLDPDKRVVVKTGDKNWYKRAALVAPYLRQNHNIPVDLVNKYIICHWLDCLSLADRLVLVEDIYNVTGQQEEDQEKEEEVEGAKKILKSYFDARIFEHGTKKAIVLAGNNKNNIYILDSTGIKEGEASDFERLEKKIDRRFKVTSINNVNLKIVGFMHPFKNTEVVCKLKDMTEGKSKKGAPGEKLAGVKKETVLKDIAILSEGVDFYSSTLRGKDDKYGGRYGIAVILEVILRYLTEIRETQDIPEYKKIFFFDYEQTIANDIVSMKLRDA